MSLAGNDLGTSPRSQGRAPESHGVTNPPAVLCDFDDTTAVENVAQLLIEHFSKDGVLEPLRRQYREGSLTLKEYQERAFAGISAGKEAMQEVVRARATLRPYFKELWHFCRSNEIPLAVVTVGLDFYVEALLEREGLEQVPRYAVQTSFTPQGIAFQYPHPWDGSGASPKEVCQAWGNCKCSVLSSYRRRGHSIIYVGDGRSDLCPATIADRVFARDQLAVLCNQRDVPFSEFRDFQDVIHTLEDWNGLSQRGDAA